MNPPEPQRDRIEQTIKVPPRSDCKFVLSSKENKRRCSTPQSLSENMLPPGKSLATSPRLSFAFSIALK